MKKPTPQRQQQLPFHPPCPAQLSRQQQQDLSRALSELLLAACQSTPSKPTPGGGGHEQPETNN